MRARSGGQRLPSSTDFPPALTGIARSASPYFGFNSYFSIASFALQKIIEGEGAWIDFNEQGFGKDP
jgi:hypothetical protein